MDIRGLRLALGGFLALTSGPVWAQGVPSSAPNLVGEGMLTDGEGHDGRWQVSAMAQGNNLIGTLSVQIAGRDLSLDMATAGSYRENGRCYVRGETGRDRIELAGPCDIQPFAGSARGFLAGTGTIAGQFSGTLAAGGAFLKPPATARAASQPQKATPPKATPPAGNASLAAVGLPQANTAPAQRKVAVNANSGPFTGSGNLSDHDGNTGTWKVGGTLAKGLITGSLSITLGAREMTVDLEQGKAYLESGFCVLKGVNGRNRFQLRGRCDQEPFAGKINGYFDQVGTVDGEFTGSLVWGNPQVASANGLLPSGKLTCSYMERIGGVVAGDLGTREIRPSALGSLTLSGSSYVARNGSGSFVRQGSTIRLTSGPWAGAVGILMPDSSGQPAVYFELQDNRRADGTYIVDPWRTFCTKAE